MSLHLCLLRELSQLLHWCFKIVRWVWNRLYPHFTDEAAKAGVNVRAPGRSFHEQPPSPRGNSCHQPTWTCPWPLEDREWVPACQPSLMRSLWVISVPSQMQEMKMLTTEEGKMDPLHSENSNNKTLIPEQTSGPHHLITSEKRSRVQWPRRFWPPVGFSLNNPSRQIRAHPAPLAPARWAHPRSPNGAVLQKAQPGPLSCAAPATLSPPPRSCLPSAVPGQRQPSPARCGSGGDMGGGGAGEKCSRWGSPHAPGVSRPRRDFASVVFAPRRFLCI